MTNHRMFLGVLGWIGGWVLGLGAARHVLPGAVIGAAMLVTGAIVLVTQRRRFLVRVFRTHRADRILRTARARG